MTTAADVKTPRPVALTVEFENIPAELKDIPSWVVWRYDWTSGKWTKPPRQTSGAFAKSNDPTTWTTFENVKAAYLAGDWDGVGFVLADDGPFCAGDLDHCVNADGEIAQWAENFIEGADTYTERSPGGGIRFLIRGKWPIADAKTVKKVGDVEAFNCTKYVTLTGRRLDGAPSTISPDVDTAALFSRMFPRPNEDDHQEPQAHQVKQSATNGDDVALLRIARGAKNGGKFVTLFDQGDTTGHRGDASVADLALCSMLAFYTGPDPGRIDRLFRASALMREKWERQDYRDDTIGKALDGRTVFFDWNKPARNTTGTSDVQDAQGRGCALTDAGNGERFADLWRDVVRYDAAVGRWRYFDGKRWAIDATGRALNLAKQTARKMLAEAAEQEDSGKRGALIEWAKETESRSRLAAMLELARSEPGMSVTVDQWDADPWAFNLDNGTLDTHTGELRPHRAADLITKLAPVRYDAQAQALRFTRFIDEIFAGDAELIRYVQRFLGNALAGERAEQLLPVFHGGGANGKSVLLDAITHAMGEYAGQAPPDLLTDSGFDKHPTELADVCGKRLIVASETEKHRRLRVQLVKRLTGDATLKARYMRQDFFEFRRTFALVLVTNNLPQVDEDSEAVWRRIRLVPFNVTIPENKRDKHLLDKLKAEASGILNWLVAGCLAYQRDGLGEPPAVAEATQGYREESDPLADFLRDCCTVAPNAWASSDTLRRVYERWAGERGDHLISGRDWPDALRKHGAEPSRRHAGRGWSGIGLLADLPLVGVTPEGGEA